MCNQIHCTEWSLQISIIPSTIQHFPNANETEFHIAINSKSFVVGNNHTLLFTGQGQASAGQKVRKRPHRRVDETVERGRVSGEGRAGRGKADAAKKYYTYVRTVAIDLQDLVLNKIKQAPLWHTLLCTYTPICNDFYIFLVRTFRLQELMDQSLLPCPWKAVPLVDH